MAVGRWLGVWMALGVAVASAADIRLPVELYSTPIARPREALGTGIVPEVDLRVRIDPRGRVAAVEINSITPSTFLDPLFRRQIEEEISSWRYAPKLVDGRAVAAELSWKLQFLDLREEDGSGTQVDVPTEMREYSGLQRESLAEQRRRRLETLIGFALEPLRPGDKQVHSSAWFTVHTDSPQEDAAKRIDGVVRAAYGTLNQMFSPTIEMLPENLKLQVFAYSRRQAFVDARTRLHVPYEWASGLYSQDGLILTHLDQATDEEVVGVLLHESTHAFLDRHIAHPNRPFPRWLAEGLATYLENSAIKKGKLIPGKTMRRFFQIKRGRVGLTKTGADHDLKTARQALRQGRGPTLGELTKISFDAFYGEDRELYYPMSWMLVHFLRHAEDGWAADEFPRLVLYSAAGFPVHTVLETVYGRPLADLDRSFRDYIQSF